MWFIAKTGLQLGRRAAERGIRVLEVGFKLSATKALNGSMLIFMQESKIHNNPAAIQTVGELGMKNNAIELRMAPTKK